MPFLNLPPVWCSDITLQKIETARGHMSQAQFLALALKIGLGHIDEDIILRDRNETYDVLRSCAINNKKVTEALELRPVEDDPPTVKTPANVAGFGSDMTRRSAG